MFRQSAADSSWQEAALSGTSQRISMIFFLFQKIKSPYFMALLLQIFLFESDSGRANHP